MASISSLMSSSAKGTYSNANAITGLASGLDTESLIEQAVSGYEMKIEDLQKEVTMLEWEQEAYRELIDLSSAFVENYISLTADKSLQALSTFTNASSIQSVGTFANLISASGKSASAVSVLGVKQLATAASYVSSTLGGSQNIKSSAFDLDQDTTTSNINGSLTLKLEKDGAAESENFTLEFSNSDVAALREKLADTDNYTDANEALAALINEKLEEKGVSDIEASVNADGVIEFGVVGDTGTVSISGATGDFAKLLESEEVEVDGTTTTTHIGLNAADVDLLKESTLAQDLNGKTFTVTVNGVSRSITLNTLDENGDAVDREALELDIQEQMKNHFGDGAVSVAVDETDTGGYTLSFGLTDSGSTLSVSGSALKSLGFSGTSQSGAFSTNKTLAELGIDLSKVSNGDDNGDGTYNLVINDVKVGSFTESSKLSDIINAINKSKAGVTVSYSSLTNQLSFTAKETGSASRVEIEDGSFAAAIFGAADTRGQDAKFIVKVNGQEAELTRSSNTINMEGMSVTLKGTFGYDESGALSANAANDAVTFKNVTDTDELVDFVKDMVDDFNEIMKLIRDNYTTTPLKNTKGERYEPLSEEDEADMSESQIETYNKKVKTGLLFGDRDLSDMYNALVSAVSQNVSALESIGITTVYKEGMTTLSLDEDALTDALNKDAEAVAKVFAGGGKTYDGKTLNGFGKDLSRIMQQYTGTLGTKGILLNKAGSPLAPLTVEDNEIQKKMDSIQEQIEKWRTKLQSQVDYYTNQFTQLEMLISQMNSQSSMLAGFGGGY